MRAEARKTRGNAELFDKYVGIKCKRVKTGRIVFRPLFIDSEKSLETVVLVSFQRLSK